MVPILFCFCTCKLQKRYRPLQLIDMRKLVFDLAYPLSNCPVICIYQDSQWNSASHRGSMTRTPVASTGQEGIADARRRPAVSAGLRPTDPGSPTERGGGPPPQAAGPPGHWGSRPASGQPLREAAAEVESARAHRGAAGELGSRRWLAPNLREGVLRRRAGRGRGPTARARAAARTGSTAARPGGSRRRRAPACGCPPRSAPTS